MKPCTTSSINARVTITMVISLALITRNDSIPANILYNGLVIFTSPQYNFNHIKEARDELPCNITYAVHNKHIEKEIDVRTNYLVI